MKDTHNDLYNNMLILVLFIRLKTQKPLYSDHGENLNTL